MTIQRKHFDQLSTKESWRSPVSVIAHIDLDAFYAQCLGVHYGIDPSEPLGCRQWNSLIAINYPARKFELKRGVAVDEAEKLCPGIHLPHVATFKKGETTWDFHEKPDPNNYKVSLDHFRRESRKIFTIFKEHFRLVEKAGIDEGFVDLGPDVYREALRRYPSLEKSDEDTLRIKYDELLNIGAELVNQIRIQIFEDLKYTCSAGIAPNKQLAKLGSGYRKPYNQTVVYPSTIDQFLANFKITDAWGWGGKVGKQVIELLDIGEVDDQCSFIREKFSLSELERKLKGNTKLAENLYRMVRGEIRSEVTPRTLMKSMVAVKDFRRLNHLETKDDIEAWLRVFAADLSGRLGDLEEYTGSVIVPKTISVKHIKDGNSLSKQQPFKLPRTLSSTSLLDEIYAQSNSMASSFVDLPCVYLVVEISNLYELPKERLLFQNTKPRNNGSVNNSNPPTAEVHETRILGSSHEEEPLFVEEEEEDGGTPCPKCGKMITSTQETEHSDWHFAKDLQREENMALSSKSEGKHVVPEKPVKRAGSNTSPVSKKKLKNQKSIIEYFKK